MIHSVLAASHCRCMINTTCCIYSKLSPHDGQLVYSKHVEDDYWDKLREKSASCWSLLCKHPQDIWDKINDWRWCWQHSHRKYACVYSEATEWGFTEGSSWPFTLCVFPSSPTAVLCHQVRLVEVITGHLGGSVRKYGGVRRKAINFDVFEVCKELSIKTVSLQGCEAVFICDLLPPFLSSLLPWSIL